MVVNNVSLLTQGAGFLGASKFLVSKETVVLRRLENETWKLGFIKKINKGRITTVNDLESLRFER